MIDTPEIVETEPQSMACLRVTVARDEIGNVMGPGLNEVMGALADQGIEASGPWFTHHFRIVPDIFEFEICVPVKTAIKPAGGVQNGVWPGMTVARTIYSGPYGGLGAAWQEFNEWVAANGYEPEEDLWERYIASPPRDPRTELNRPLKPRR